MNRLTALLAGVNDILDFSRIEAGKLSLELEDFNLKESLDLDLYLLDVSAQEKGINPGMRNRTRCAVVYQLRPGPPDAGPDHSCR